MLTAACCKRCSVPIARELVTGRPAIYCEPCAPIVQRERAMLKMRAYRQRHAKPPTAITCGRCAAPMERAYKGIRLYCAACKPEIRREQRRNQWAASQLQVERPRLTITCFCCSEVVEAASSKRIYCDPCGVDVQALRVQAMHRRRREKKQAEVGQIRCARCDADITGEPYSTGARFCGPCRPVARIDRHKRHQKSLRGLTASERGHCCEGCGVQLEGMQRRWCSEWCAAGNKEPRPATPAVCVECESGFDRFRSNSRFCGQKCSSRWFTRVQRHIRRAKISDGERVDPMAIFDRDGWCCQSCGKDTPRELLGTRSRDMPSLDHIIPLSKGGEHSSRNTQCLCLDCNVRKGARFIGKMRPTNRKETHANQG